MKKLTASWFVKDLISTFVLTLLRFLRKLFLWSKSSNTRSSVLKLKYPLKNTCSDQNNLSYPTPIGSNSVPTDLKLTSSLNNFKRKLKIDTVLGASTVKFSINFNQFFLLFIMLKCFMLIFSDSFSIDWPSFFRGS